MQSNSYWCASIPRTEHGYTNWFSSEYRCETRLNTTSSKILILYYWFLDVFISEPPQDYTATVGSRAVFRCTVRGTNKLSIGFEIFSKNITTDDNTCIASFSIVICNTVIDSHLVSLTCDFSIENQINCTLTVDSVSRSSDVYFRLLNKTLASVEATRRAELILERIQPTAQGRGLWIP